MSDLPAAYLNMDGTPPTIERYTIDIKLLDILTKLNEEADLLRDGNDCASDDELADLMGEAAEEIARLRKELAEALYRNQEADKELNRLRDLLRLADLLIEEQEQELRDHGKPM